MAVFLLSATFFTFTGFTTFTVRVAFFLLPSFAVTVILAVPFLRPFTLPLLLTEAIFLLLDL